MKAWMTGRATPTSVQNAYYLLSVEPIIISRYDYDNS